MRRISKHIALFLAASLTISLAACTSASTASSAASASTSSVTSSELRPLDEYDTAATLRPLDSFEVSGDMADGTYSVGIEADGVEEHEGGYNVTATLYAYDQYDAEKVGALKAGDTILLHSDGDLTEMRVTTLETSESGLVTINGGVEEGGMYLMPEDDAYRTLTMNDYPVYYEVGTVSLPLSDELIFTDGSQSVDSQDAVTQNGASSFAEVLSGDETGFTCYNTKIKVENGEVVEITRIWVP